MLPAARWTDELLHPAPEAGLAAMARPQLGHKRLVQLQAAMVTDARGERLAFEQVPCRMAIAARLAPSRVSSIIAFRSSVAASGCFASRALAAGSRMKYRLLSISRRRSSPSRCRIAVLRPVDEKAQGGGEVRESQR